MHWTHNICSQCERRFTLKHACITNKSFNDFFSKISFCFHFIAFWCLKIFKRLFLPLIEIDLKLIKRVFLYTEPPFIFKRFGSLRKKAQFALSKTCLLLTFVQRVVWLVRIQCVEVQQRKKCLCRVKKKRKFIVSLSHYWFNYFVLSYN